MALLDGKKLSDTLRAELKISVQHYQEAGYRAPCLAVILLGHDPASELYIKHKQLACKEIGITAALHALKAETTEKDLIHLIHELNENAAVDGILVQLPLPSLLNKQSIIEAIDPKKDVDGFHPYNLGRLLQFEPTFRPCTPFGIIRLLEAYAIELKGKRCVILGASNIVGKPMAAECLMAKATVTICNSATCDLQTQIAQADLLISAMGRPDIVDPNWIKPGSVVVDVGMNRVNGKLCGDISTEMAAKRAAWITPVPGGVGPMTVTMLMHNTIKAYKTQINH